MNQRGIFDRIVASRAVDAVLLVLPLFVILLNMGLYQIWNGGDVDFPLRPIQNFLRTFFVWDEGEYGGFDQSTTRIPELFPYFTLITLLSLLGIPLGVIERIWYISIFAIGSFSMYHMVYFLTRKNRIASIVSALVFTYNPWMMIRINDGHHILAFSYALMPLTVTSFMKAIEENEVRYALLTALGLTLMASGRTIPIMTIIVLGLYFFYWNIFARSQPSLMKSLRIVGWVSLVALSVNLWWLLPSLAFLAARTVPSAALPELWYSRHSELPNVIRLFGYWVERWLPSGSQALISFILPLIAFSALFIARRDRRVTFLGALAILSIILGTGNAEPFAGKYLWMYENIPYFGIFRDPYKFVALTSFAYSPLIGITIARVATYLGERTAHMRVTRPLLQSASVVVMCALLLSVSSEIFTGLHALQENRFESPPEYYEEANEWLSSQEGNFKIFLLPKAYYVWYSWAGHYMHDVTWRLIDTPTVASYAGIIVASSPATEDFIGFLYDCFYNDTSKFVARITGITGSRYIVYRTDVEPAYEWSLSHEYLLSVLDRQVDLGLERKIGNLHFFRNRSPVPRVYATTTGIAVFGDWQGSLLSLSSIDSMRFDSSALFFLDYATTSERERMLDGSSIILFYNSWPRDGLDYEGKRVVSLFEAESLLDEDDSDAWSIIENPDSSNGLVVASNETSELRFRSVIPTAGLYKITMRASSTTNEILLKIDETPISIHLPKDSGWLQWIETDPIFLEANQHEIEIGNVGGVVEMDEIGLYSISNDEGNKTLSEVLSPVTQEVACDFTEINPTKYSIHTSAREPFFLVFTDNYDPDWVLSGEGLVRRPLHLFTFANSYYVDKTGEMSLTLRLTRQKYFYLGVGLSTASLMFLSTFLLFIRRRKAR